MHIIIMGRVLVNLKLVRKTQRKQCVREDLKIVDFFHLSLPFRLRKTAFHTEKIACAKQRSRESSV